MNLKKTKKAFNKLKSNLASKVKHIKSKLASSSRRTKVSAVSAVAALAALSISYSAFVGQPSKPKSYLLTLLAMTPRGLAPVDQMLVQNVKHQPDGAICFSLVDGQDGSSGCIKFETYFLQERSVE